MAEVLSPPATTHSPSPAIEDTIEPLNTQRQPRPRARERVPSYAEHRMSQYSRSSQRSRPQSTSQDFPAFTSSLPYALVRDFAYPVFHPLHYGAQPELSGSSTPGSDWNAARRQSDPMESWNGSSAAHTGGWSAGPWGGDGLTYGDPQNDPDLASLPSTSFGNESGDSVPPLEFGDDELVFRKGKHRRSKSYASTADFEHGRRRESGRKSKGDGSDAGIIWLPGQQSDPAGRDSLRQSRGNGDVNGIRRDSRYATTLPSRSFQHANTAEPDELDPDEHIPLDIEPPSHSPVRDSMCPEDEELFAGLSLALYSFEPENSNELRLVEGQEIMVSYRHGQGWLVASDPRSGEQGLVPEAYVRLIADMPNYDPETGEFVDIEEIDGVEHSESTDPSSSHTDTEEVHGKDGVDSTDAHVEAAEDAGETSTPVQRRRAITDNELRTDEDESSHASSSDVTPAEETPDKLHGS